MGGRSRGRSRGGQIEAVHKKKNRKTKVAAAAAAAKKKKFVKKQQQQQRRRIKSELMIPQEGRKAVLTKEQSLFKRPEYPVQKYGWEPPYSDYREVGRWDKRPLYKNSCANAVAANTKFRTKQETPYTTSKHLENYQDKQVEHMWPQFGGIS